MAHDDALAARIRDVLAGEPGLTERSMFGGRAFLVDGHLAASASSQGGILLRVDPARSEELLAEPHVTRFRMRGRELGGWLHVSEEAVPTEDGLRRWLALGVDHARSLPPK